MLIENVSKSYGSSCVLNEISLELAPGRTYALIGPSGCGKTTLLKLLIGLQWPDHGRIIVGETTLAPGNVLELRQRFGYVIQEGGLFPHLTAQDNLSLMAKYLGWSNRRIEKRTHELAELTQFPIQGLIRYPSQLSGGQRQRVSLMRALMLDPEFMLLDEPLAALDPMIRVELQRDLRGIFRDLKKTVVFVTHDLHEARFVAHEIILLNEGQVVQRGRAQDLNDRPKTDFVKQFVKAQTPLAETQP